MKYTNILLCLIFLFYGCNNPIEKQTKYLLPDNNTLELTLSKEIGITNFYIYKIEGNLNRDKLVEFPENIIPEKDIVKWHKPSVDETSDIKRFIEEEQNKNEIATKLLSQLSSGEYLTASIYAEDKSPPGSKDYLTSDWIELYFIDFKTKTLIHISYGKF